MIMLGFLIFSVYKYDVGYMLGKIFFSVVLLRLWDKIFFKNFFLKI